MPAHVYLAGPITGLSYGETTDWREQFASRLPNWIIPLSPMRGKSYLKHEVEIADRYDEAIMSTGKAITTRDRWDVQRSDVMVANLLGAERVSIGTMIEFGWADAARVPIVLVMEQGRNPHDHAMIRELAGFRAYGLYDAVEIVKQMLPGRRVEL